MRGIVIAKMLMLTVWGLYLAIGLGQHTNDGGQEVWPRPPDVWPRHSAAP